MSDWPTVTLKEAGVSLIDCDHKTPKAQEEGFPYVGIPQLKEGRIILDGVRLITEEDFHHWRRKAKPTPDDVILSRRCNPGETAYVPEGLEIALGQNLVLLRSDGKKIYPPFLRWVVQGSNWWNQIGKFINVGAVFDSLKCVDIPKFEIQLPPMESQIQITEILGALDKKIELNRQINQALEQITQATFKSWFVDFEPVKAKIQAKQNDQDPECSAMSAISGKTDKQLDPLGPNQRKNLTTAVALFPDELEDSELGEIPKSWKVQPLDKIANYLNGLALQKFPAKEGEKSLPVIKIAQLKKGNSDGADRASKNIKPEYIVDNGDVIFSWSGSLFIDIWCGGQGALNQHLFKVSSDEFPKWFYFYWTNHHLAEFKRIAADKAVTIGHIKRGHLSSALCLVPNKPLIDSLGEYISNLVDLAVERRLENINLSTIRDSLLPRLLSGEIEVT